MKKICLLLALVVVLGCVAGCTGANDDVDFDDDEETRVKRTKRATEDTVGESDYEDFDTVFYYDTTAYVDIATAEITDADTMTVIPSDEDLVTDALNYKREVVAESVPAEGTYHSLQIPKINVSTANVKKLNDKIYSDCSPAYNTLQNYTEGNMVYRITYEYRVYKNLVAIVVDYASGHQCSHYNCDYRGYYFDLNNDRELTLDEYVSKLGYNTESELISKLGTLQTKYGNILSNSFTSNTTLISIAAGSENTYVVLKGVMDGMTDTSEYTLVAPVAKK